jgi:hypothetical protein
VAKSKEESKPVEGAETHAASMIRRSTVKLRAGLEEKRAEIVEKHGQAVYDDAAAGKLPPFKLAFLLSTGMLLKPRKKPRKHGEKLKQHRDQFKAFIAKERAEKEGK